MRTNSVAMLFACSLLLGLLAPYPAAAQRTISPEQRAAIYRRMDANNDGRLEMSEVPERARPIVARAAKEAGLDSSKPMEIDKLLAARSDSSENDEDRDGDRRDRDRDRDRDDGRRGDEDRDDRRRRDDDEDRRRSRRDDGDRRRDDDRRDDRRRDEDERRRNSNQEDEPAVPGFGETSEHEPVPGFDVPLESTSTSGGTSESGKRVEVSDKIRRYAQSLVRQYDKNKNGVLEKSEWSRMRGDPERADLNRDGVVTVNELGQRLATYSQRRSRWNNDDDDEDDDRRRRYSRSSSRDDDKGEKEVYRFKSAHERLPKGLPSWFTSRDSNGDGQVSMAEYARSWNDSAAREFSTYDLNGDGIVTPGECLAGEK